MICQLFGVSEKDYKQYIVQVENKEIYDDIINDLNIWFEKYLKDLAEEKIQNQQNLYHIISCLECYDDTEPLAKEYICNAGIFIKKMKQILKIYCKKYPQKGQKFQTIFHICQKEILRKFDVMFDQAIKSEKDIDSYLLYILYHISEESQSKTLLRHFLSHKKYTDHSHSDVRCFVITMSSVLKLYNIKFK